jgi:hypothetical protein
VKRALDGAIAAVIAVCAVCAIVYCAWKWNVYMYGDGACMFKRCVQVHQERPGG